ncbi:MAG: hypothetical protein QGH93_00800 [Gammaproteobacteria bacterium]|nr:hypothetical protein [Gammaproteobacteria bacterium]
MLRRPVEVTGERWTFVIDHSILTLEEPQQGSPGRLDQLSGSIGYRFFSTQRSGLQQSLDAGIGFRHSGEIGGARMQNGFHQIINNGIKTMPYIDRDRVDGTLWASFDHSDMLKDNASFPLLGDGWRYGYWMRGATMLTTDGQWDGEVRLAATADKNWLQGWVGLIGNWREGYDRDNVSRETARNEAGTGITVGLRLGPLLIETERPFNGEGAYGHMSLVSTGQALSQLAYGTNKFSLQTGLTMPDIYVSLQGRWTNCNLLHCDELWQRALVLDSRYGKPQFGSATDSFVETIQVVGALEFEHPLFDGFDWLTSYVSAGIGWRREQLEGEGILRGQQSEPVSRPGLAVDAGVRLSTSARGDSWNLIIQLGISGWLPSSDGAVRFAGETERLQRPELNIMSGVLLEFF